jgi:RNA polymerase sigma factor (sigma-70 family)
METVQDLFLSQLPVVDRIVAFVVRHHVVPPTEAEEFAAIVRLRLIEDDYAILRKFQGSSSLKTYLTTVITRLFLDFRRSNWGKWRPSAEARHRGEAAIALETLLHRDGFAMAEACRLLEQRLPGTTRGELERIAAALPTRFRRRFESDEALESRRADEQDPESAVLAGEAEAETRRAVACLRRAIDGLPAEDRLILRMRFDDGMTIAAVAANLRLEAKPLYRRLERLLRDLRASLEREGLQGETVLAALGSSWMEPESGDSGRLE